MMSADKNTSTGTTGTALTDATMTSYKLMGGNLKAHVGHQVEITGTTAKDTCQKDTTAKNQATQMSETLDVKSVKMLSTTCPLIR